MFVSDFLAIILKNVIDLFADLVAEVTQPSLGVGYELGRAVAMGKKILCLYRPQSDRSMYYNKNRIIAFTF